MNKIKLLISAIGIVALVPLPLFAVASSDFRIQIKSEDSNIPDIPNEVEKFTTAGRSGQFIRLHNILIDEVIKIIGPEKVVLDGPPSLEIEKIEPDVRLVWNATEGGKTRRVSITFSRSQVQNVNAIEIIPVVHSEGYFLNIKDSIVFDISAYNEAGEKLLSFEEPVLISLDFPSSWGNKNIGVFYFDRIINNWIKVEIDEIKNDSAIFFTKKLGLFTVMYFGDNKTPEYILSSSIKDVDTPFSQEVDNMQVRKVAEYIVFLYILLA